MSHLIATLTWMFEKLDIFNIFHLIAGFYGIAGISVLYLLFPCIMDPTFYILVALWIPIFPTICDAEVYGLRKFFMHLNKSSNCSTRYQDPAPVYLVTSKISLTSSSSSSALGSEASSTSLQTQIPIGELVNSYPPSDRYNLSLMHWTLVIRGTAYELLRKKWSDKAELKVTPFGSYSEVDALGIPLTVASVEELGNTYLTNEEIFSRVHETISFLDRYNPVSHNCQTIWDDHLISRIICQCQDQKVLLRRPDLMRLIMDATAAHGVLLGIVLSVITLLREIGSLPFQTRWCSISSQWGYIILESWKYLMAMCFLPYIYKSYMQGKPVLPYLDVPKRLRRFEANLCDECREDCVIEVKKELSDPDTVKPFKKLTDQVVSLVRLWIVAAFLSTIFGFLRRFHSCQACQVLELGLVVILTLKTWTAMKLVELPGFPLISYCEADREQYHRFK